MLVVAAAAATAASTRGSRSLEVQTGINIYNLISDYLINPDVVISLPFLGSIGALVVLLPWLGPFSDIHPRLFAMIEKCGPALVTGVVGL